MIATDIKQVSPSKSLKIMALDNDTVHKIARLARLSIADEEVSKYATELSNILELVEQMEAADTEGVEPMTHPFDASLRLREDAVTQGNQREKFQALAPESEQGLYLVPKVID